MAVASALDSLVLRASARARVARGVVLATWTLLGLGATAVLSAVVWSGDYVTLAAVVVLTFMAFCVGLAWPVSRDELAATLDRVGGLDGRIAAGVSFQRLPVTELRDFAAAALRDAERRASLELTTGLAARAVPVRWPRAWPLALLLALGAVLLVSREPARQVQRAELNALPRATEVAPALEADDLATRTEAARVLSANVPNDERLRAQLADYQSLLASLTDGRLGQEAALQRVLALEAALAQQALLRGRVDPAAATSALQALADELRRVSPALARALQEGDAARAAQVLRSLSEGLSHHELAEREREQLRRALEQARAREQARAADEARERELSVLQARDTERAEPSLLRQRETRQRELEKLRRRAAARPKRTLEKLSRELGRAGTALSEGDSDEAADALDAAGSALDRYQGEQHDDAQERALARELSQLRELLQQRALDDPGSARDERARREAARQRPSAPGQGAGADGSRKTPTDQPPQREEDATEQAGANRRPDEAEPLALDDHDPRRARRESFDLRARGHGEEAADGGVQRRLGPASGDGKTTRLVPVDGERSVVTRQVVTQTASAEHDEERRETPTSGRAKLEDRALSGSQGDGPTRSQVIRSAAQSGFASLPYRKVYGDYRAHAEAAIEADAVPAGYRFQVRRYFELVRPRSTQEPSP